MPKRMIHWNSIIIMDHLTVRFPNGSSVYFMIKGGVTLSEVVAYAWGCVAPVGEDVFCAPMQRFSIASDYGLLEDGVVVLDWRRGSPR